ncbi:photoreceptor cilium actin regulator [Thalassophryne amazonica]|uniref:photoreceptor cilium actin regulator n=1 Tax=Thalassophryne amazonica TaxID=390379 RepID=UPI001471AC21|nr:photoreceptor cilium actin regulator [Thalassophryne amazonica]
MGCSPSKGNFGAHSSFTKGRMLPSAPQQILRDAQCEQRGKQNTAGATNDENADKKKAGHTPLVQSDTHLLPQKKKSEAEKVDKLASQGTDNNSVSQRKEKHEDKPDIVTDKKSGRKLKKNTRGIKMLKKKDKDKPAEQKVDFPEPLVKAHQAAYAFMNPSISKYDTLLEHLEKATQTQVFVQPMVAFMVLRYDKIIQALEEMADEGENVFKEIGEHLAWPSQMKNVLSSSTLKSGSADTEPPPDLLQQLLQYTTQRMQNVSKTVGGIGDSALEETVEYFSSISELLEEKLKVKRVVESRLMRLLSRIEAASLHKTGPEDSALFSEDSGIGAESESLAGSERCHRRESCASSGTNRTTPVNQLEHSSVAIRQRMLRQKLASKVSPSVSLTSLNSTDSTCTLMAKEQNDSLLGSVSLDDGEENDNDVETDGSTENKQVECSINLHSSLVYTEHQPCRLPTKRIENPQNVEMTLKMKNAISGKIQFVSQPNASAKYKSGESVKASKHQWAEDYGQTPRRPQTAAPVQKAVGDKVPVAKKKRSRSADSLRSRGEDSTLLELERTQKDLSQKLQRMNKSKARGCTQTVPLKKSQGSSPVKSQAKKNESQSINGKAGFTRQTNSKKETSEIEEDKMQKDKKTFKGLIKATPPPSPPLSPRPPSDLYRGRNSVRKLINTFSQGIEVLDDANVLGPLKGVRKCGVPVLPGLGNVEAVLSTGITSCRPENTPSEKTNDLDMDNLPPPTLEVLMDNSFESSPGLSASIVDDGATKGSKSLAKRPVISQRLRASVQSVTVLPSKASMPQGSKIMSTRKDWEDSSAKSKFNQPNGQQEPESEKEKGSSFSKQPVKMEHQESPDSQSERVSTQYVTTNPSTSQAESVDMQDDDDLLKPGSKTTETTHSPSVFTGQSHAILPMSKTRMLPITPSTQSSLNRKLPSPQKLRKQPTSPSPPPVNRKLPTPHALQKRLPSPPVTKEKTVSSNTTHSCPFKAPSPPASPKVQRSSRRNSSEDSYATRVIRNACSVFCPAVSSIFHAQVCPVPPPPEAWTSTGVPFLPHGFRNSGRFPVSIHGPKTFIQRSYSDRRPSLTVPQRPPGISAVHSCGSEPSISTKGLEDDLNAHDDIWSNLSAFRATLRSVSHPDLCVVGQSLHKV